MSPDPGQQPAPAGVVVVDKPTGLTSHQVVGRLRRLAHTRKVGHAGTLDPMATGVLVIGIGRATRLLGHLTLAHKSYRATIRLGLATLTDDAEGEVTARPGAVDIAPQTIDAELAELTGEIMQVPSTVSAIKVDGKRSYARVRSGESVELAARPVTVTRFELISRHDASVDGVPVVDLDVEVDCSSGTYIRALARDLGTAVGSAGHLTVLRRTTVGPFGVDRARTLDQLEDDLGLVPIAEVAREFFPSKQLNAEQAAWVRNGRRLSDFAVADGLTALYGPDGAFLALYRGQGTDAVADAVFV